jgi:hypothetical protein
MLEPFQNASDDFQKTGKDNYDAMLRSYGELSKRPGHKRSDDRVFEAGL